ncbi:MAG: SPFH domain-containing protein [Negativicutes bacterium]|nr:SPFH domain-containing protein [Negativicutes bacterium]
MGLIRAAISVAGSAISDQWLEVIEPDAMSDTTVMTSGVTARRGDKRNLNRNATEGTINDGSVIHVYPNQFMILLDGGGIVDFTAEEGYYTVSNVGNPSLFAGDFADVLQDTWKRVKFGGMPSGKQKVVYINTQEIKGIKFGTRNPIGYFDNFYNAELFLRAHGTYSIKITDPILFYTEALPHNKSTVEIEEINEQYFSEFMSALQAAINQMSVDGIRISYAPSKSVELSNYMANILDIDWRTKRGFDIQSVGIASISYDEESAKLINMRNQGAMLSDANVREGYIQGSIARGLEAAGANPAGSMSGFMGIHMGNQTAGGFMAAAANQNMQQNGTAAVEPTESWKCSCGATAGGNFCSVCGAARPGVPSHCSQCGYQFQLSEKNAKFCPQCGKKR